MTQARICNGYVFTSVIIQIIQEVRDEEFERE